MDDACGWGEVMHFFWLMQQGQLEWKSWSQKVISGFGFCLGILYVLMTMTGTRSENLSHIKGGRKIFYVEF